MSETTKTHEDERRGPAFQGLDEKLIAHASNAFVQCPKAVREFPVQSEDGEKWKILPHQDQTKLILQTPAGEREIDPSKPETYADIIISREIWWQIRDAQNGESARQYNQLLRAAGTAGNFLG